MGSTIERSMNTAKVQPEDYVQFLLGSPLQFTCTEAARVQPDEPDPPAHDAFTRLLTRLEPDPEALRQEARPQGPQGRRHPECRQELPRQPEYATPAGRVTPRPCGQRPGKVRRRGYCNRSMMEATWITARKLRAVFS